MHHLALEPRGTWHLEKRQHGNGNQVNKGVEVHTDNGTPFFADYAFYDWTASVEHTITSGGSAQATKKTFLKGSYNDKSDLTHAGFVNFNLNRDGSANDSSLATSARIGPTKTTLWLAPKVSTGSPRIRTWLTLMRFLPRRLSARSTSTLTSVKERKEEEGIASVPSLVLEDVCALHVSHHRLLLLSCKLRSFLGCVPLCVLLCFIRYLANEFATLNQTSISFSFL